MYCMPTVTLTMLKGTLYSMCKDRHQMRKNKTGTKSSKLCSPFNLYRHQCEDSCFLYNVHVIVLRSLFISDYNFAWIYVDALTVSFLFKARMDVCVWGVCACVCVLSKCTFEH